MRYNLNGKKFKALSNSENGQVSNATLFHYHQKGDIIWTKYQGGEIMKGSIVGTIKASELNFIYQHVDVNQELKSGKCATKIELNASGKYILKEKWQ